MKNKLLIYSQEYDIIQHECIIDKDDLEAYTQNHIKEFLKDSSKRTILFDYISHEIKSSEVHIKYLQHAYTVLNSTYKEQDYYNGFKFIDLDKMPTWEAQPKALKDVEKSAERFIKFFGDNAALKAIENASATIKNAHEDLFEAVEKRIKKLKEKTTNAIPPPIQIDRKPTSISIDRILFNSEEILGIPVIRSCPRYADVSSEGYSEGPWIPSQKVLIGYEYDSVEFSFKANHKQLLGLRKVFDSMTRQDFKHNLQTIIINWDFDDDKKVIKLEGFLRDLKYTISGVSDNEDHTEIEISFVINNILKD